MINHFEHKPLGKDWIRRFLAHHPELRSTLQCLTDAAHVKDMSAEAFRVWFDAFHDMVEEYQISPGNIFNFDESGFSIGKIEASHIIINSRICQKLQANPGRQEWVSVIECICVDGTMIPPLVIFKGENL